MESEQDVAVKLDPSASIFEKKIERWIALFRLQFLVSIGQYIQMLIDTVRATAWRPPRLGLVMKQAYSIGVGSITVVATTGLFTGLVLAAQAFYQLNSRGLSGVTGLMVAKAMISELGPVLTAFMVTGRVGAAVCAELGTMKVTEQIDALKTLRINTYQYLIIPRIAAGTMILPFLTTFAMICGIVGGYMVCVHVLSLSPEDYRTSIKTYVEWADIRGGLIKAAVFGFILPWVGTYKGYYTRGGARGVGNATTQSVVTSSIIILVVDYFLTKILEKL